ncbi:MAG TPA: nodulation protein NfeD [Anaerolineales bacterium]|nr:nodulation protein NfeD [Anaerolineales bacterium]
MRRIWIFTLALLFLLQTVSIFTAQAQDESVIALALNVEGPLTPALVEYLDRGLSAAQNQNAELVILQLNTPGGSVELMTRMVEAIRSSPVPVVVYVAPRGAIAGSAGTVITLAGHLTAMAPETAIGAASPVDSSGEDIGETMEAKVKEIIKAQIRSLTEGRLSPEAIALAEDTVENATALSAGEAFQTGLVGFIADDITDLLRQIDGQTVTTAAGQLTLSTSYIQVEEFSLTLIEELLTMLTNPNIVFLLLTVGVQAILIEISSPGGWVAGFIGVISLSLAAYGLGILPVNWFGLIFIATAFVLFFLEVKAPTQGALTTAGVASFIAGALLLFNSSNTPSFFRVSVPLVVVVGILTAGVFFLAVSFALRAQRTPIRMGQSSLVGRTGRVRSTISKYQPGKVHVASELWSAELTEDSLPAEEGDEVEVIAVDGLRLKVRKKNQE